MTETWIETRRPDCHTAGAGPARFCYLKWSPNSCSRMSL